ncbi:DUF6603 domain-containing protein [Streptomyces pseudogriseolus]|uniref:DUF6603 domain-containing protein n=1 Tax=Streptomyces pseudogriseolus TaxID=36817 RepID=UPI001CE2F6C8|nr:DUF6603 domain-containing protein [Streptomyces pseudogriseolus]
MGAIPGLDLERFAAGQVPETVDIDAPLPPVRLRGRLMRSPDFSQLSGVLSASLPAVTATAFGEARLKGEGSPSFLVLLGAAFPEPGLQVGFGFALSGVGGIVGVNRRIDREALIGSIADGTADELLFPPDPARAALRVLPRLPALFPATPGRLVVGPMFKVSWGGRMISLSAAVVAELPDPVRLSVLGVLRVAVPDPAVPLIELNATFAGQYDSAEPSAFLMASLNGSHMAGIPLNGDVLVLSRGGPDATFVLSAGGFHPAFTVPRGVPPLHRLSMNLAPVPWIQLRCEAYFAITSNTVQFGAQLSLVAEIAGCGLRGEFGLDVLVYFEPTLRFTAAMRGSLAVRVLGETLLGIAFSLTLEGPAPWHAVGRGSIDLFLFEASFDFDETWGSRPPPLPSPPPDLEGELRTAFRQQSAWTVLPPGDDRTPVRLSPAANRLLATGGRVHPHGRLVARQRVLPFGVDVQRFGRTPVEPAQHWDVAVAKLGEDDASRASTFDSFAPGLFLSMTEDQQLGSPAFEDFRSGVAFVTDTGAPDDSAFITAAFEWETRVIDGGHLKVMRRAPRVLDLVDVELVALASSVRSPHWWQPARQPMTITERPGMAVMSTWSMTEVAPEDTGVDPGSAAGGIPAAAELRLRLAGHQGLKAVESWEVQG